MKWRERRLGVVSDFPLQRILCSRVALYWILCSLSLILLAQWRASAAGGQNASAETWRHVAAASVLSISLLPVALFECVMWSNRLLGPLRRLRETVHHLANGEQVDEVNFRPGDYLKDIADDVNRVARRLHAIGPCLDVSEKVVRPVGDSSDAQKFRQEVFEVVDV